MSQVLVISVHHIYLRHAPSFGGFEHHTGSPYILSTPPHLAMPAQQAVVVAVVVVVVEEVVVAVVAEVVGVVVVVVVVVVEVEVEVEVVVVRFVTGIGVCLL